jgi:DNA invertase Pin-like site-specific DNA recombinase
VRRIAVYSRQSNQNDVQVEEHTRLCVERVKSQGDTVVGPFQDDGVSGFNRKTRPGYEAMLAAVAGGEADAIMAVRYDRLLRDPREGFRLTDIMDAAGISSLRFIEEADIDLSTAAGRSEVRKRADGATYYSDSLSEKVQGSKRRIARAGRWCGSPPYGYDTVNDHPSLRDGSNLVVNKAEADVVREIVAGLKAGATPHQLAMSLRSRGFTTGGGGPWTAKALRRAVLSPAIAGIAYLNGEELHAEDGTPVPVVWKPIISRDEYEVVKERLAPGSTDRHPEGVNLRHPLTGLLRCARVLTDGPRAGQPCGTLLNGATLKEEGRSRYTCSTERGGCGGVSVTAQFVEPIIVKLAVAALLAEKRQPVGGGVAADVHEAAAAELSAVARDRAKLNALAESDMFSKEELAPKFAALKKRETKAKATLRRPVAIAFDPRKVAATIQERWAAYQKGDRDAAELLHDEIAVVVDRIDVAAIKPGTRRNVFDPNRLTVRLKLDTLKAVVDRVKA